MISTLFMSNSSAMVAVLCFVYAFLGGKIKGMGIHVKAFKINQNLQLPRNCSLDSIFLLNLSADSNHPPTRKNPNTQIHTHTHTLEKENNLHT